MARITFGPLNESDGKRTRDLFRDGEKIATLVGDVATTYHKGVLRGNLYHVEPVKGKKGDYAKAMFAPFTWYTWTMARRGILAVERGKPAPSMVGNEPQLAPSVEECDAIAAKRDADRIAAALAVEESEAVEGLADANANDLADLAAVEESAIA